MKPETQQLLAEFGFFLLITGTLLAMIVWLV
jgi:hypothetical protein